MSNKNKVSKRLKSQFLKNRPKNSSHPSDFVECHIAITVLLVNFFVCTKFTFSNKVSHFYLLTFLSRILDVDFIVSHWHLLRQTKIVYPFESLRFRVLCQQCMVYVTVDVLSVSDPRAFSVNHMHTLALSSLWADGHSSVPPPDTLRGSRHKDATVVLRMSDTCFVGGGCPED